MSELKKRIAEGEGIHLDFKFRIDDQKKIARTLSAFANSEGGSLLIGVKDNGKIAGTNPEEEYYMIEGAASLYCNPPVRFESKVWQEEHHLVLEISVPKSKEKHKSKDEEGQWKFYHRIDDHTLLANRIVFLLWKFESEGKDRPEKFTDEVIQLLQAIEREQPVTVSKLFRVTSMNKNKVNETLATLLHWKVIDRVIVESGVGYLLSSE